MTAEEFASKVRTDGYQLFLLSSPIKFPLNFAVHTWFVAVDHGVVTRWDILFESESSAPSWGHLHKNCAPPHEGITKSYFVSSCWESKLLAVWNGVKGSSVEKLVSFLNTRVHEEYPHSRNYVLSGPNSNTFTKWVLSKADDIDITLPVNAFGRHWSEKNAQASSVELGQSPS